MPTNRKSIPWALLLLTLSSFVVPARAQMIVTGHIQDNADLPVAFANVQLLQAADSSFYAGTLANEAGDYVLERVKPGHYLLYVSLIGYRDHLSNVLSLSGQGSQQLAPVILIQQTIEMEGLSVEARRTLYEQQGDRLVINVGTSVTLSGATALDVLERSPGVIVNEQSSTISMLGKDGVRVMIDGKLSYLPAESLVQYLSGMSADNIETIELITSPPAEFDAEGNAGFINIVLKRRPDEGLTGSLSASGSYGNGEVGNASTDVNYQRGRISLFGNFSFLWNGQQQVLTTYRQITDAAGVVETPSASQRDPVLRNYNARFGTDYLVSEQTTIGALVAGYEHKFSMNALTQMSVRANGAPVVNGRSDIDMFNRWRHVMGNLNLRHQFRDSGRFTADVDYLRYHNDMPVQNQTTLTDVASGQAASEVLDSDKITPLRILAAKADFHTRASQQWELRAGVKGAFSRFTNEATFVVPVQDTWIDEVGHGGKSVLREEVLAAYGSASYQRSEAASLEVGLRYELTDSNLGSEYKKALVDRRFGNLFPSAVYQHKLRDDAQLTASYTRRITRPSFSDLASFTRYENRYTLLTGNLALQPAIMNALKVDVTYKSVLASLQYAWEDSTIAQFQNRIVPGQNIQIIFPMNMGAMRAATALLAAPVAITGWWSTQNSVLATWQQVEGLRDNAPATASRTSFRFNSTQNISLPADFDFEATGSYQSAILFGTARFGATWGINLGLQRALPDGKGQVTLSVDDLFNTQEWLIVTGSSIDPLYVRTFADMSHRTFRFTYSMRFGGGEAAGKRATASESEGGRVAQ